MLNEHVQTMWESHVLREGPAYSFVGPHLTRMLKRLMDGIVRQAAPAFLVKVSEALLHLHQELMKPAKSLKVY